MNNIKTPCFVINTDDFLANISNFKKAINKQFPNNIYSYSVKTNWLPYILKIVKKSGCYAEVVSSDEYNLAKLCGYKPSEIIYNGPAKDEESFLEAISNGAYVNLETKRELEWLKKYDGIKEFVHLGIRLNIDLGRLSPEDANVGAAQSRFGFSFESGEFSDAVKSIQKLGFNVSGVHVHRGTKTRSLKAYTVICQFLTEVVKNLKLKLDYVDIGGGFYGSMQGKPDYNEYVETIKNNLKFDFNTIIFEPGNGVIASPVDYVLSIIDKKKVGENIFLQTDGTRLDVDPMFHKLSYKYELEDLVLKNRPIEKRNQILGGCTCMENDRIMELSDEKKLAVGDKVIFHYLGAYTMCLTPNFIRNPPRIYSIENKNCRLVRKNWDASSWFFGEC